MWGREMRAGLAFVLVSLLAGGTFREWKRSHETRFADLIAALETRGRAAATARIPADSSDQQGGGDSGASRTSREQENSRGKAPATAPLRPAGIDLDRASVSELERLPGIGPVLAARIVADRDARGPFGSPDGLLRVSGVGPRTLARIRTFLAPPVAVDSGSPIAK